MFRSLKDFQEFSSEAQAVDDAAFSTRDVQVAVVALLAELAHSDGEFTAEEITRIVECMNSEFDLTEVEVGELLEISDYLRRNHKQLEDYFAILNKALTPDHKIEVVRLLWIIMGADNQVSQSEGTFAVKVRQMLGLTLEQATRAQMLARSGNRLSQMPE